MKARDKLFRLAVSLREQAIVTGAWATLSGEDGTLSDICLPAFLAKTEPEGFYHDGRWGFTYSKQSMDVDVEKMAADLIATRGEA